MSKRVNNKKGNRASKRDFRQKTKVRGGNNPSYYSFAKKTGAGLIARALSGLASDSGTADQRGE